MFGNPSELEAKSWRHAKIYLTHSHTRSLHHQPVR